MNLSDDELRKLDDCHAYVVRLLHREQVKAESPDGGKSFKIRTFKNKIDALYSDLKRTFELYPKP